jgi:hypothetical protein
MAKKTSSAVPTLFAPGRRNRRVLILPRFLQEESKAQASRDAGLDYEGAHNILVKWADLESKGRLDKKETSLNANFLNDIFGNALGYPPIDQAADGKYLLEREFPVPGVGSVDGALGHFPLNGDANAPVAIIELKGPATDLDTHRSNGRTAVNQLFDYLNALPGTKWGLVSNISTIRLYHKDRGSQAYEEFSLQNLRHADHFAAFWCLLEKSGLFPNKQLRIPARADDLLTRTQERQKTVGDELYEYYADQRSRLIEHLRDHHKKSLDDAIHIAQRLLDRIVFIAFCEDRGLLGADTIKRTWESIPPYYRVTNPRWRAFLDLFHVVDKGQPNSDVPHGYNGGLFAHDSLVDDLQLEDDWTNIFTRIAGYEFRDEVNVDVLGHIFERSITELEKKRVAGVFGPNTAPGASAKMQKSAERKRFGIYYTPPEFTRFLVREAVEIPLRERLNRLEQAHNVTPEQLAETNVEKSPQLRAYYMQAFQSLRRFKIVDPACGSGAFLIAAYECLDEFYDDITRHLIAQDAPDAQQLRDHYPDLILQENLYGVDLSEEAVEITRLALWIRSARPGKTLANLTHNILCGNSLVNDPAVHPRALNWQTAFPDIFGNAGVPPACGPQTAPGPRAEPGFDAVIGNPPWERLKLQEREFFALSAPDIASAVSAATRRKLIEQLENKDSALFQRYLAAASAAEKTSQHVRDSNRFPLTAKGDINTYMLFAELARSLVAPSGRVGLLVPSGIATDNTTKDFFADLIDSQALIKLYDFENRLGIFPDVDGRFKFCTLILGGSAVKTPSADFLFFAHSMNEVEEKDRHIPLTKRDISLLNPNTNTCPIFRSRKDAQITKAVYSRIPILVDDARKSGGNPWKITYYTMLHQTNDADQFEEPSDLKKNGFKLDGNIFRKGKQARLPVYEAKMIQSFDHRAASIEVTEENWVRQGQTTDTRPVEHENPEFVVLPRWWVKEEAVDASLKDRSAPAYIAIKDVTSATNQRTMIAAFVPRVALVNSAPLLLIDNSIPIQTQCCLLTNLNSFPYDYIARQKVGGNHLNFFIVEQLPTLPPDAYVEKRPFTKRQTLEQWISERVLKLSCTANDMIPLAKACNFNPKGDKAGGGIPYVWKWKDQERADLRAQLDAAYFHLYGLSRDDTLYILSTFQAAGSPDDPHSTTAAILEYYDQYADA